MTGPDDVVSLPSALVERLLRIIALERQRAAPASTEEGSLYEVYDEVMRYLGRDV